ncbi:SsgA family sporulation/cell division regulator, partial [Streptomyces sp. NPDC051129]
AHERRLVEFDLRDGDVGVLRDRRGQQRHEVLFSALRRFLLRTYAMVPGGREDVTGVVERGLSALFGGV